ncbi:hypothetical protein FHX42_000405 [Saccharopolyspora lacisalsi]|uniref:Uncharacterized protein n=1 Tax=Halosaccharopolyspora lacisalsi TaxID=1000566 RepID=A0A839DS25_9PSEU|nr:hypothetical protein [Halosaccharopolyspora lacisalsi]
MVSSDDAPATFSPGAEAPVDARVRGECGFARIRQNAVSRETDGTLARVPSRTSTGRERGQVSLIWRFTSL